MKIPVKIFFGNEARGLEKELRILGIKREHLDFAGKLETLSEDPFIESVEGNISDKDPYIVKLRYKIPKREILAMLRMYRFSKPNEIEDEKTKYSPHLKVNFEDSEKYIVFIQPGNRKRE